MTDAEDTLGLAALMGDSGVVGIASDEARQQGVAGDARWRTGGAVGGGRRTSAARGNEKECLQADLMKAKEPGRRFQFKLWKALWFDSCFHSNRELNH